MTENRRFLLKRRPVGEPRADDFETVVEPVPRLEDGTFLIRNLYVSLDPAMRGWLDDRPSYQAPVAIGDPVRASTVGRVVASRNPAFPEGACVTGLNAIEDYTRVEATNLFFRRVDANIPLTYHLSALGGPGLTAFFGMTEIGRPVAGETVLVTAAAGAVGSIAGQIARIMGCRVIGIAGGEEKCRRAQERYGFDAMIDYRGKDTNALAEAIAQAAPNGVDLIFENVGGILLDAGLLSLNTCGRVALCGLINDYNRQDDPHGTRQLWQLITKRARIEGFLLSGFKDRFAEGAAAMRAWLDTGEICFDEEVVTGMEAVLPAFLSLFQGTNRGKIIVELD